MTDLVTDLDRTHNDCVYLTIYINISITFRYWLWSGEPPKTVYFQLFPSPPYTFSPLLLELPTDDKWALYTQLTINATTWMNMTWIPGLRQSMTTLLSSHEMIEPFYRPTRWWRLILVKTPHILTLPIPWDVLTPITCLGPGDFCSSSPDSTRKTVLDCTCTTRTVVNCTVNSLNNSSCLLSSLVTPPWGSSKSVIVDSSSPQSYPSMFNLSTCLSW